MDIDLFDFDLPEDLIAQYPEQKRDHLINASDDFSGQVQAYYFSNARRFLSSMVGDLAMNGKQDLKELRLKKLLGV